jgi:UDP-N-acetylglucosamine--N-acetylmuramyl-(pentapeptide) pyrophosphoryl-undecaprenol N-acetylglucosamine transferase
VVVGAGGYVSGPVLMMAVIMGIPTLVMDSNALPGFTNRRLAKFVDRAALTFHEALPYFGKNGTVTGNPVRKEFFETKPKERTDGRTSVLIFGGSQGARAINNAMIGALEHLNGSRETMKVVHQTGEADFETVRNAYHERGWESAEVRPYISDMMHEFEKADILVCRAGATTCAEIAAAGKAAVMIPLPTAADDHQRKNAEAMQNAGAAKMLAQDQLTPELLASTLIELAHSPETISAMESGARKLARVDAAEATVDIIEELARD